MRNGLTHNINGASWTSNALRIILDNIGSLKNALYGARFNVELVVAETVSAVIRLDQSG